jgi:hypothetical protein
MRMEGEGFWRVKKGQMMGRRRLGVIVEQFVK